MPVPARRHSRSKVRRRRSHDALKRVQVSFCQTCHAPLPSHRACTQCGMYKGKRILDVSRHIRRLTKRAAARGHSPVHNTIKSSDESPSASVAP